MRCAPLTLAAAVAAAIAAGCGGGADSGGAPEGAGPLVWVEPPLRFTPETLPDDRVVTGELRNEGLRRLRVDLPELRVRDSDGDTVAAQPVFLQTFGKPLWSPARGPERLPESELLRTGRIAWLDPGESVPFTLAWRTPAEPTRVEYDGGWVPIP